MTARINRFAQRLFRLCLPPLLSLFVSWWGYLAMPPHCNAATEKAITRQQTLCKLCPNTRGANFTNCLLT